MAAYNTNDEGAGNLEPHRRNAAHTRRQLLQAARRRFAGNGYSATTVRDIARDAGVDAALISRYFGSKEDLFVAALEEAVHDLSASAHEVQGLPRLIEMISRQVIGVTTEGDPAQVLLLLLRSSGDERAEQKRVGMLRNHSVRIASAAGWTSDQPGAEAFLLRAQLVLAAAVGVALLRSSPLMEPLASATVADLLDPLRDLVMALLGGDTM